MDSKLSLVAGIAIGAGLMYIFDPDRGRRRRSLARDQLVHGAHEIEDAGGSVLSQGRHMRNRARGVLHETTRRVHSDDVDDGIVEARVRSRLGHLVSDPTEVRISSEHGRVTLRGSAPAGEFDELIDGIQRIPGVHDVINRLGARENAG